MLQNRKTSGSSTRVLCFLLVLISYFAAVSCAEQGIFDLLKKFRQTPAPTPSPTPTLTLTSSTPKPAGTSCTQPRVRKSWENYSSSEKTLYLNAVALAMRSGLHQKFVQLHVEYFSELEAHRQCMFIYWHRMYLLGYENMLRSQGSGYECVTVPVWDHLAATSRRTTGACQYMEDCAPIVTDFGGSTQGVVKNLLVYNETISSSSAELCVNRSVVANFCGNNTACAGCVVRGSVATTRYPGDAFFASVYTQVFSYNTWDTFRSAVEGGVHNSVHSNLGGIMAYFQSPIDPLFYSHHAFVDALQVIYLKCQLGSATTVLNGTQKASDSRFWANCPRRSTGSFTSTDDVFMRLQSFSNAWVQVRTNALTLLYPYFKDLPPKYADYVDAKDLGVYSYSYDLTGALQTMLTDCGSSVSLSSGTSLEAETPDESDGVATTTTTTTLTATNNKRHESDSETKARHWSVAIYESARLHGYTERAAEEQMEMVACLHKHECLGEVQDYSALFRKNFRAEGHPRCFTLVQALLAGDKVIGVPHWRDISKRFVPCPNEGSEPAALKSTAASNAVTSVQ